MLKIESILFPVDFSDRSKAVAPFVLSMAQRYDARVTLLHTIQPAPPIYAGMNTIYPEVFDYTAAKVDLDLQLRRFAESELPKAQVRFMVEIGDPAYTIIDVAAATRASVIAMPTHGYGVFRRALLGSVTAKVLHDTTIPVWTSAHAPEASHRAHPQPRHILAALDLKTESRHTLEVALEIAEKAGATVEMIHMAPEGDITGTRPEHHMHELLAETAREHSVKVEEEKGADVEVVMAGGSIARMIRDMALRKRADLVVVGRGAIQNGMGLKTNAYDIIRESPCPVLSV